MPDSALASLEIAAARKPAEAMKLLIAALRRIAGGGSLAELAAPEAQQDHMVLATRFAAAMARIMTVPAPDAGRSAHSGQGLAAIFRRFCLAD
jgi:hypothetical protein